MLTSEVITKAADEVNTFVQEYIVNRYGSDTLKHPGYCGFGWVEVKADGRSKIGKLLRQTPGFSTSYKAGHMRFDDCPPIVSRTQTMDIKEFWADRMAAKFRELGLDARSCSRAD